MLGPPCVVNIYGILTVVFHGLLSIYPLSISFVYLPHTLNVRSFIVCTLSNHSDYEYPRYCLQYEYTESGAELVSACFK